jgi:hypothetical protein
MFHGLVRLLCIPLSNLRLAFLLLHSLPLMSRIERTARALSTPIVPWVVHECILLLIFLSEAASTSCAPSALRFCPSLLCCGLLFEPIVLLPFLFLLFLLFLSLFFLFFLFLSLLFCSCSFCSYPFCSYSFYSCSFCSCSFCSRSFCSYSLYSCSFCPFFVHSYPVPSH